MAATAAERDSLNTVLLLVGLLLGVRLFLVEMGGDASFLTKFGTRSEDDNSLQEDGRKKQDTQRKSGGVQLITVTPIPGPQALRPIVGHCQLFKTQGPTFEFCGYKSMRQIFVNPHKAYYMGTFKGWKKEIQAGGEETLVGQEYLNGDVCDGFGSRETLVKFLCKPTAEALEFVSVTEDIPCKYIMTFATRLWCNVEAPVEMSNPSVSPVADAGPSAPPPPPSPAASTARRRLLGGTSLRESDIPE